MTDAASAAAGAAREERLLRLGQTPEPEPEPGGAEEGWQDCGAEAEPVSAEWALDDTAPACGACAVAFTLLNRRHHCRECGKIFCGSCSAHRKRGDGGRAIRVCVFCAGAGPSLDKSSAVVSSAGDLGAAVKELGEFAAGSVHMHFSMHDSLGGVMF